MLLGNLLDPGFPFQCPGQQGNHQLKCNMPKTDDKFKKFFFHIVI